MTRFSVYVMRLVLIASLHNGVVCMNLGEKIEKMIGLDREIEKRKAALERVNNAPIGSKYNPRDVTLLNKGVNREIDWLTKEKNRLKQEIAAL